MTIGFNESLKAKSGILLEIENAKDEMKRWFQSEEEQLLQIEELLDQSQSERGECC